MLPRVDRRDLERAVSGLASPPRFRHLRRVIADEDDALAAWLLFRAQVNLDRIDGQSMKMLPLALRVLERRGYRDPEHARLSGMVRFMFVRSQKMREVARRAAEILRSRCIVPTAIKGLALAVGAGASFGERPMLDADLVVSVLELAAAVQVLKERGFAVYSEEQKATTLRYRGDRDQAEPINLDLHGCALDIDPGFLAFRWLGEETEEPYATLDPTGMLIVTVLHGLRQDGGGLWQHDVDRILRHRAASVSWSRLLAYAQDRHLGLALGLGIPVMPDYARGMMRDTPVSVVEALELRHVATGDRMGAEAANAMRRLRMAHGGLISATEVEEHSSRVRWDRRWLSEWQR